MASWTGPVAARARALALLNGGMLKVFDRRTVAALHAIAPLRAVLGHLEPMLALNVDKEKRKDALVFKAAGEAISAGVAPNAAMVQTVLDASRRIDQDFLARVDRFPVRVVIRYEDVVPLRRRRIQCLFDAGCRILGGWSRPGSVRAAIRSSYTPLEFEAALNEVLRLYTQEARALSRAVRLPLLLVPLRELAAQRLSEVMSDVGARLARDVRFMTFRA